MTHFDQDELAVLLLMSEQKSSIELVQQSGPDAICALLGRLGLEEGWFFSPGSRHLPAEIGGRVAQEVPKRETASHQRGHWLRQFDAGYCMTDFEPLKFDRKTLTYTGTILWDSPGSGPSLPMSK